MSILWPPAAQFAPAGSGVAVASVAAPCGPAGPCPPCGPTGPCAPGGPTGPCASAAPCGPGGIATCVHTLLLQASSIRVALAYATSPELSPLQLILAHSVSVHLHRVEEDLTYATVPESAVVHFGRPLGVEAVNATE